VRNVLAVASLKLLLTASQKEQRRLHAMDLLKEGKTQREVARVLGVTEGAVSRWVKARREKGSKALKAKPRSGRPPKLDRRILKRLPAMLVKGADAHGFENDVWTTARVAKLIKREFGVAYNADHVGRLLRQMGLSWQKPERRARERDEARIQAWIANDWPRIKKKPSETGP
jgi:transposase